MKSQIQVVRSTIENFNNTITNVEKNNIIFRKNFKLLNNYSKNNTNKIFDLQMKQQLEEHVTLLTLLVTEFKNELDSLINAVLFAKSNILHPVLITPAQFIDELRKSIPNLPQLTSYPLALEDQNAVELLSLINVKVHEANSIIIFAISIPLVTLTDYELFHLIPLPTKTPNNNSIFILPNSKYLAISNNKALYTHLDEIDNCKSLSSNYHICPVSNPVISTHSKPNCETEILLNPSKIPYSCDTRLSKMPKETWYKLTYPNKWIYSLKQPIFITINCNGETPVDLKLNKLGTISLNQNCKAYTPSTILTTQNFANHSGFSKYQTFLPTFDITQDNCCQNISEINFPAPLTLNEFNDINFDHDSLRIASHKLGKIKEDLSKIENKENIVTKITNNSYFSYIFMTIVKMILIFLVYKLLLKCKRRYFRRSHSEQEQGRLITNCITFNICRKKRKNVINPSSTNHQTSIPLEELASTSDQQSSCNDAFLRRSPRLAKLKD